MSWRSSSPDAIARIHRLEGSHRAYPSNAEGNHRTYPNNAERDHRVYLNNADPPPR